MSRAVAPWTWRRMLRDHAPDDDPGFLLAMLVLATYMNDEGFAYPGQATWARGARMSKRNVQRHLARARELGWISVVNAGRSGKGWAFNGYRSCIPDHIELDKKDEKIAAAITARAGDVSDDTIMSPPKNDASDIALSPPNAVGSDTAISAPTGASTVLVGCDAPALRDRDDTVTPMVTTSEAVGDDKSSNLVATQLWRTNSHSENSRSITHTLREGRSTTELLARVKMGESKSEKIASLPKKKAHKTEIDESDPKIQEARQQAAALAARLSAEKSKAAGQGNEGEPKPADTAPLAIIPANCPQCGFKLTERRCLSCGWYGRVGESVTI